MELHLTILTRVFHHSTIDINARTIFWQVVYYNKVVGAVFWQIVVGTILDNLCVNQGGIKFFTS